MAFSDDNFLSDNQCEICGAPLSDEVVIQEFADGSIARLCAECAAGAQLQPDSGEFQFPELVEEDATGELAFSLARVSDDPSLDNAAAVDLEGLVPPPVAARPDAMEKTRELLTPVVDLIGLQQEMQGALGRLATSLQTFANGVITDNIDKSATVESRLEALERELEITRARLREAEAKLAAQAASAAPAEPAVAAAAATPAATAVELLAAPLAAPAVVPAVALQPEVSPAVELPPVTPPPAALPVVEAPAAASPPSDSDAAIDATAETAYDDTGEFSAAAVTQIATPAAIAAASAARPLASDSATQPYSAEDLESTLPPMAPPAVAPTLVPPPSGPPTSEHPHRPGFALAEVQIAQKYFNDSQFTNRIRDVRKSLGRPKANLSKLIGAEPRALLTVAWDIIWYQYVIDLRRDIPTDHRVALHREGMDLDELQAVFKEKNSSVDDEGRLDASELEVKLLSDPSTLITEMSIDEERALEDATEEIWDQKTAPEFKWDD